MSFYKGLKEIFIIFFKVNLRRRRNKFFIFFCLSPVFIVAFVKTMEITGILAKGSAASFFSTIVLFLFINFFIPIISVFIGSSVIKEEIEDKTLPYLTTRPLHKASLLIGKFLSGFFLIYLVVFISILIMSVISNYENLLDVNIYYGILQYNGTILLSILAYSSLFTMLSMIFKRSTIIGLMFIFGWENIVQYFPGSTQNLTISHFIKSLLPQSGNSSGILLTQFNATPVFKSIIILLTISVLSIALAIYTFRKKEYLI